MRKGQRFYLGNALMQKGIQRPVFTAANGFDTGRDLFIIDGIDAVYAEDPQCHQRQKGKPQMRECGIEPYPKKVQTKPPQRKETGYER